MARSTMPRPIAPGISRSPAAAKALRIRSSRPSMMARRSSSLSRYQRGDLLARAPAALAQPGVGIEHADADAGGRDRHGRQGSEAISLWARRNQEAEIGGDLRELLNRAADVAGLAADQPLREAGHRQRDAAGEEERQDDAGKGGRGEPSPAASPNTAQTPKARATAPRLRLPDRVGRSRRSAPAAEAPRQKAGAPRQRRDEHHRRRRAKRAEPGEELGEAADAQDIGEDERRRRRRSRCGCPS